MSFEQVLKQKDLQKVIEDELLALGRQNKLSGLERPKKFHFTDMEFSIDNDLMTPTFKLKRHKAKEVFKTIIDKLYEGID